MCSSDLARVRNHLRLREYALRLEQMNEELERLATTDALTSAFNRRYFMSKLEDEVERVRRYKRRLKDHHANPVTPLPSEIATGAVLTLNGHAVDTEERDDDDEIRDVSDVPLTVAETSVSIRKMSVSEAVMQLELQDVPALMFRNAGHDGLNMVYRRPDGHIGWVDPANTPRN